jgi:hypothetical protein
VQTPSRYSQKQVKARPNWPAHVWVCDARDFNNLSADFAIGSEFDLAIDMFTGRGRWAGSGQGLGARL